jgi:hypothetical protein
VSKVADGVHYCQLLIKSTGKLALYVYGGGNSSYDGTGAFTLLAGSWYHVVLTYDAAGGLKGYVNGSLDASVGGAGNLATNNATTSIGNDLFSAGRSFNGAIDEVRVSTVARPADWIVTEYNNQSAPGNVGADNFLKFGTETVSAATGTIRHRVVGGE